MLWKQQYNNSTVILNLHQIQLLTGAEISNA